MFCGNIRNQCNNGNVAEMVGHVEKCVFVTGLALINSPDEHSYSKIIQY